MCGATSRFSVIIRFGFEARGVSERAGEELFVQPGCGGVNDAADALDRAQERLRGVPRA